MSVNAINQDELQREVPKRETLARLYKYMFAYKKTLAAVLGLVAVTLAVSLATPLLIEQAVDGYVAKGDAQGLLLLGGAGFLMFLVFMAGTRGRMLLMEGVTNRVLQTIRQELYTHIQSLSFHFFDSRPTGKILARVVGDVNSLKEMYSDSVTKLLPDLLTVMGVAIIMIVKNWKLALAALLTLPFLAGGMLLIQGKAHRLWQVHRKKNSNLNAFIHEDFSGIRIVQSFAAEQETRREFQVCNEAYRTSFIEAVRIADLFGPLVEITWGAGGFLLYYIGIQVIGAEQIGVGTFMAFSTYLAMFWSPVRNLASFYNKIITNLSAAERIFVILDTPAEIRDQEGAYALPEVKGEVTFSHVSFAYTDEPERMVLEDVSFQVKPGETIALVGPTGAGKTTIVNLISRFYDITSGEIRIDGHEIHQVTLDSLRRQMGVMTQDTFLFTGTVRENICYGRPEASQEEMVAAAKAVNAHDFIMELEDGYDTLVSERGGQLSVGQRQLLAFARTMVSDPKVLILDEATSSIDTIQRSWFRKGFRSFWKTGLPSSSLTACRPSVERTGFSILIKKESRRREVIRS